VHVSAAAAGKGAGIVFLHQIEPGPASRSYGIQVARLAGMPSAVLNQAQHTLSALEAHGEQGQLQVDLFAQSQTPEASAPSPVEAQLAQIDPDALSPREALDALYALKRLL
jgi:DNA mismatch repair protein MutS